MPLFQDDFNGSGTIAGHAPDVTLPGYQTITWTSVPPNAPTLSGTGALAQTVDDEGFAVYAQAGAITAGTGPVNTLTTFTIRTAANAAVNTGADRAWPLYIKVMYNAGITLSLGLLELTTGWELDDTFTSQPVTLIANTSYTGTIQLNGGVYTYSFLGKTGGLTVAPSSQYTGGVSQLRIKATPGISFEQLSIADPNANAGTANVIAPMAILVAGSIVVASTAVTALTAPKATLRAFSGARITASAPSATLSSTGHDSYGEQAAFLTTPSSRLRITTGASAQGLTAPMPGLAVSATGTNWSTLMLSAPRPALSAKGRVSGASTAALSAPRANLVGYGGAVCSVSITGSPTVSATGTTGSIGGAQITCPLFELTSTATAQNSGSADLLAPSPMLGGQARAWLAPPSATLTAIGTAVVTATYEAYVVNLKHSDPSANDETTHYTNFPFTHVVRYQNSYYGANSTGLYLLEGTADNGAPIPWEWETAITDFKSPNKKTLAAAYFSGRFGTSSTIQLKKGEKSPITHAFTTPRGTLAQNHRQVFGKDRAETRTRYFALAASGTGEFELDAIECDVHNTTRRI